MNTRLSVVFIIVCAFVQASCYWRQYGGKAYYFSHHDKVPRNYSAARDACNEQHGGAHLVSINSEGEQEFLSLNEKIYYFWIGLTCTTGSCNVVDLRWADGSRVTYHRDFSEMPAGRGALLLTHLGNWTYTHLFNDWPAYICERNDPCSTRPCLNNGTCLLNTTNGNWICKCQDGATGNRCSCDDNMCHNGRPCVNGADEPSCDCGEAFAGPRCELDIDECVDVDFCNGGICTNLHGGFNCTCPPTRQGDRCASDVNECQMAQGICQHGSTCRNEPAFNYTCDCVNGYIGEHCQIEINGNDNKEVAVSNEASIAMLAVGCLLTIVGAIALCLAITYVRTWKKRMMTTPKRQTYAAPEANTIGTELYEITNNPHGESKRDVSQTQESLTTTSAGSATANEPAHIYEFPEPDKVYVNTLQPETNTYDTLTF